MLLQRMSQAGKPAALLAPGRHTSPAGKEIKGPREEAGAWCRGECPSRAPGWGGPSPAPQHPTRGLRGMPCLSTKLPKRSLASLGREDEVREAFFKYFREDHTHIQEG